MTPRNHFIIFFSAFRKEEKRVKIEENRRLKQIHDNNQKRQQLPKQDVSLYLIIEK